MPLQRATQLRRNHDKHDKEREFVHTKVALGIRHGCPVEGEYLAQQPKSRSSNRHATPGTWDDRVTGPPCLIETLPPLPSNTVEENDNCDHGNGRVITIFHKTHHNWQAIDN